MDLVVVHGDRYKYLDSDGPASTLFYFLFLHFSTLSHFGIISSLIAFLSTLHTQTLSLSLHLDLALDLICR